MAPTVADVVIVGAGPIGCLIAYQLARFGCTPYLMEKDDKKTMPCYGRATTLWPRTIEIFDQLDLFERLMQTGVVTRNALHFRKYETAVFNKPFIEILSGERIQGGFMFGSRMDKLGDTFFKFALHLRQRLIEEHFTEALEENGVKLHMLQRLQGFDIDETESSQYPVIVQVQNLDNGQVFQVRCKYLIGADGGKSTVRSLAGIPFPGERTTHRWIRMDARVQTNMPNSRCLNSIDSPGHGQILWCPIDNGLTRIGYVFSQALLEKYGGVENVTQEIAVREAKEALRPFEVKFEEVEWFTIYGIGQAIAETFYLNERILLAGDACHTHSSGSAQGLNTGVQDAVNLSWKLALVLHGFGKESLLKTYDLERRPSVQQVINNDKVISTLISVGIPASVKPKSETLPRDLLTEWYTDVNVQLFTLGLGISYSTNILNSSQGEPSAATIRPGERGPDVFLTTIGTKDPVRLHQVLKNDARFSIVILAGKCTHSLLASFQSALPAFLSLSPHWKRVFKFVTIAAFSGNGATDVLGRGYWGRVLWDSDGRAHAIYGVDEERGAVIVFRPDGWIGCVLALDGKVVDALGSYFGEFLDLLA